MIQHHVAQAHFSFVHFTDTHLMAGARYVEPEQGWEVDTYASLQRIIAVIKTLQPPPAFAVVGGDLASPDLQDRTRPLSAAAYEPSYRLLQEALRPLPCPVYLLLGNHDHRVAFHRVMQTPGAAPDAPHYYSFDYQGYHFIALDSHEPGKPWGYLDAGQLAWLRADLAAHREQPTLVFVHHHPWPLGLAWLDSLMLRNGDQLTEVLRTAGNVRWVICGHVHLDQHIERHGLTLLTSPSTCFQISKLSQQRKLLTGPPGFRLVQVQGLALSTRVVYVPGTAEEV